MLESGLAVDAMIDWLYLRRSRFVHTTNLPSNMIANRRTAKEVCQGNADEHE